MGLSILVVLASTVWRGGPLEGTRPASTPYGTEDEAIPHREVAARLWHDPFKAMHTHREAFRGRGETRKNVAQRVQETVQDGKPLTILAVMMTPGPYGALEERRRRRRYAVVSALGAAGFHPQNAESLEVFAPAEFPDDWTPYEWFDEEDGERRALVLWLDESRFQEQPFGQFGLLLHSILQCVSPCERGRIEALVLGPARSRTLEIMARLGSNGNAAEGAAHGRRVATCHLPGFLAHGP